MQCNLVNVAALIAVSLGVAPVAAAQTSAPAPNWKPIYQDNQTAYYIDSRNLPLTGESTVASLIAYKVAQVNGGSQVWSVVSHMKVDCDQREIMTTDNTFYALKMGTGPVVQSQPSSDNWHAPQPDSLGGLIWSAACRK